VSDVVSKPAAVRGKPETSVKLPIAFNDEIAMVTMENIADFPKPYSSIWALAAV
jgi:hypothetical protein